MKFEVKSVEVIGRTVTTKKGQSVVIREQKIWLHGIDAYPVQLRVTLWGDSQPYAVGMYTFGPGSFSVDRFGGLKVNLDKLKGV